MREILAAWACCCLLGFGALGLAGHRDPGIAADARIRIPDRLAPAHPGLSIEDEFADDAGNASDAASVPSNSEEPSVNSPQDVAESGTCRLRSFGHRLLRHAGGELGVRIGAGALPTVSLARERTVVNRHS